MKNSEINNFKYYSTTQFNELIDTNKINENDLKTINLNIRGLNQNYNNFTAYLSSIPTKFDVIILSECHIQKDEVLNTDLHNKFPLLGYNMFYIKSTQRFGGVVVYIKETLNAVYMNNFTQSNHLCDSIFLKVAEKESEIIIAGFYSFCHPKRKDSFTEFIENQLSDKSFKNKKIIIGGDMNICLLKSTLPGAEMNYLNTLLNFDLEQHIFYPTRIQHYKNSLQVKSLSLIDHIASNLLTYECKSGCLYYPDSDHYATFLLVKNALERPASKSSPKLFRRNYKNINIEELKHECNIINWEELVIKENNVDKCFENIIDETQLLHDKHAPMKEISKRKAKHIQKPWIDKPLVEQIKRLSNMYSKYKKLPNKLNTIAYKTQKNKVTKLRREKQKKYYHDYFEKFKNDAKRTWQGINLALDQTRNKKSLPGVIYDSDNKPVTGAKNKAKSFAKYFENVPAATIKKIPKSRKHYKDYMSKKKPNDNYFDMKNCEIQEVEKHILQLKNNSSTGPIKIPNHFLKLIALQIAYPLHIAINKSMEGGYFPKILKIGKQTPVFKAGEHHVSNFRPITVCNSFSKILEKIVRDRLSEFIESNKIINNFQFGFRKGHSTAHATINLLEAALDGLDEKLKTGGVYLDISKAFDTVNHDILLSKLEFYGIRKNELMWFQSYLKNREQYVEIEGEKSDNYITNIAVPQGGTLSAMLFIIFTNDITVTSDKLRFSIFADDTSLIISIDRNNYDNTLKAELNRVIDWFSANQLLLNVSKTEYSHFGPNYNNVSEKFENGINELHQVAPLFTLIDYYTNDEHYEKIRESLILGSEYKLAELAEVAPKYLLEEHIEMEDGTIIENSENVKYLGLQFDCNLKFQKNISIVSCKISRMVGIFWRLEGVNLETKKLIYHSLVESHFNYGILVWCSELAKNLINGIDNAQGLSHIPKSLKIIDSNLKKIIRAIFKKPKYNKKTKKYTETSPLFKQLNVLKLQDMYYYNLALLVHDYFYNPKLPESIKEKFDSIVTKSQHNTRSDGLNIIYNLPKSLRSYKKPSTAGSIYWNRLPIELRKTESKSSFKRKLKEMMVENY